MHASQLGQRPGGGSPDGEPRGMARARRAAEVWRESILHSCYRSGLWMRLAISGSVARRARRSGRDAAGREVGRDLPAELGGRDRVQIQDMGDRSDPRHG